MLCYEKRYTYVFAILQENCDLTTKVSIYYKVNNFCKNWDLTILWKKGVICKHHFIKKMCLFKKKSLLKFVIHTRKVCDFGTKT